MYQENILLETGLYEEIMRNERKLSDSSPIWLIPTTTDMYVFCSALKEDVLSAKTLRKIPFMNKVRSKVCDSNASHTNTLMSVLDGALKYLFGGDDHDSINLPEGYSYRKIMNAAKRLNLVHNKFDAPTPEDVAKYNVYRSLYVPSWDERDELDIERLMEEAREKSSEIGRLIFIADVVSDIIFHIENDILDPEPISGRKIAKIDYGEFDYRYKNGVHAAEVLIKDYFMSYAKYDDHGFFTAIIVMYTLQTNGKWFTWREKEY